MHDATLQIHVCKYYLCFSDFRTSGVIVECLLNAGADPNIQNVAGETPLMIASKHGIHASVKILANCAKCDFNIMVKLF